MEVGVAHGTGASLVKAFLICSCVHQPVTLVKSSFTSAMMRLLHLGAAASVRQSLAARRDRIMIGWMVACKRPVTLTRIPGSRTFTPFHPEETEVQRLKSLVLGHLLTYSSIFFCGFFFDS